MHEYLLVEFALTLLHNGLKRGALLSAADVHDAAGAGQQQQQASLSPVVLGRLDPMVPLLVRALKCRWVGQGRRTGGMGVAKGSRCEFAEPACCLEVLVGWSTVCKIVESLQWATPADCPRRLRTEWQSQVL